MFGKKIKVCSKCSGFNLAELDEILDKKDYSIGCIGVCKNDKNKCYAKINGRTITCDNKDELLLLMKATVK